MVQSLPQAILFEEFVNQYGDDSRYELIDGELVDIEPTDPHEQVSGFINGQLNLEIQSSGSPISSRCDVLSDH
jgi:Uma2 family endonuclease